MSFSRPRRKSNKSNDSSLLVGRRISIRPGQNQREDVPVEVEDGEIRVAERAQVLHREDQAVRERLLDSEIVQLLGVFALHRARRRHWEDCLSVPIVYEMDLIVVT